MSAIVGAQDAAGFGGEEFTAWLEASCRRQGLPVTIRDRGVIAQVAVLLGRAELVAHRRPSPSTSEGGAHPNPGHASADCPEVALHGQRSRSSDNDGLAACAA